MSTRADFSDVTRQALAERVAFKCSFPGCLMPTLGPSEEGQSKSNRTGMACHIVAASGGPGARRVVKGRRKSQLSKIDNGIWMCFKHGKLIDADETRFTIGMLKTWREVAELRARLEHELGGNVVFGPNYPARIPFASNDVELPRLGEENRVIGEFLDDCCVNEIWGREVGHAIRDLAIEVARNAFQHGKASRFKLAVEPKKIILSDDGQQFPVESLLSVCNPSGGAEAIKQISAAHGNRVVVSSSRIGGDNLTTIGLVYDPNDVAELTPCVFEFEAHQLHGNRFAIPLFSHCETTYIVMPFVSYSDAFKIAKLLSTPPLRGRRYSIVSRGMSSGVESIFIKQLPNCTLMNL